MRLQQGQQAWEVGERHLVAKRTGRLRNRASAAFGLRPPSAAFGLFCEVGGLGWVSGCRSKEVQYEDEVQYEHFSNIYFPCNEGSKTIQGSKKILGHGVRHSLLDNLSWTLLLDTLAGHSCFTLLLDNLS